MRAEFRWWAAAAQRVLTLAGAPFKFARLMTDVGSATPLAAAIAEAEKASLAGEVPVGAVVADAGGRIVATAGNRVRRDSDPTAHAEMLVLRAAARALGSERLIDCDLYVTLEPCAMCAQAVSLARIRRLYFGAADPKGGAVEHGPRLFSQPTCHHRPEVYGGIDEARAAALLRAFFLERRSAASP